MALILELLPSCRCRCPNLSNRWHYHPVMMILSTMHRWMIPSHKLFMFLFWRFFGDVRREFIQRLSATLHGTFGSYLRDAFQEGSVDAVTCLLVPRA
jgi:hypothetical protein